MRRQDRVEAGIAPLGKELVQHARPLQPCWPVGTGGPAALAAPHSLWPAKLVILRDFSPVPPYYLRVPTICARLCARLFTRLLRSGPLSVALLSSTGGSRILRTPAMI